MTRRNFSDGMEITFGDLNKIPAGVERLLMDRVALKMLQDVGDAFFGGSFLVSRTSATGLSVAAGVGFQTDNTQVSPEPTRRLLYLDAAEALNIVTPDATDDRIDLVCVKADRVNSATATRKFKDATSSVVSNETLTVETDWAADLVVVEGTPDPSPVAPSVPAGYLKICTVEVTALTGIAVSGALTDERDLLPVGEQILLDTTGLLRLTAGVAVSLRTILEDIDEQIGSGGGGGGLEWSTPADGTPPMEENEYGMLTYLFGAGMTQKLVTYLKVPDGYVAGQQITMNLGLFSPSASGTVLLKTRTYLIKKNLTAVDSTTNLRTSTNTAITNTVAKMDREISVDLTSATGTINSVAVAAGDRLRIELYRDTDTDTADVRFIPSVTDPVFS